MELSDYEIVNNVDLEKIYDELQEIERRESFFHSSLYTTMFYVNALREMFEDNLKLYELSAYHKIKLNVYGYITLFSTFNHYQKLKFSFYRK
eukprot:UN01847